MRPALKVIAVVLVVVALHALIWLSGVIPFFDFRFYDVMSRSVARTVPPLSTTVVVEIDEASLRQLGQWPWPRLVLARVLQQVLSQRPAAVGFDVFFPEPDRTSPEQISRFYREKLGIDVRMTGFPAALSDHDRIFAQVLVGGPTVLPLFATRRDDDGGECVLADSNLLAVASSSDIPACATLLCNTPVLQRGARGFGFVNSSVDSDGVLRRQALLIRYRGKGLPSLVLALLGQIDPGMTITTPSDSWTPMAISFANRTIYANHRAEVLNHLYPRSKFKRISAVNVLAGKVPDGYFTGKMVLIGATAAGLFDQYATSSGEILPGVFAHAALLENIIHQREIYQPEISKVVALAISYLFSMIIMYLVIRRHYLLSWGLYLGVSLLVVTAAWQMLQRGVYVSLGYFLTTFSLLFFCISLFFAILHYVERKRFLEDLGAAHSATIDSMTMVAESRDVETGAHITRTKEYVAILARELALQGKYKRRLTARTIDILYRAAPLHDIGKVGIPDSILRKPGRLSEVEMDIMKTHVDIGYSIIVNAINNYNKTNEFLTIASNITYSHHEKWDGSGYPLGLKGEDIPLEGRLMALADVYDALISRRCYKCSIPFHEAEFMIVAEKGKHFDPAVVEAFVKRRMELRAVAARVQESAYLDTTSRHQMC